MDREQEGLLQAVRAATRDARRRAALYEQESRRLAAAVSAACPDLARRPPPSLSILAAAATSLGVTDTSSAALVAAVLAAQRQLAALEDACEDARDSAEAAAQLARGEAAKAERARAAREAIDRAREALPGEAELRASSAYYRDRGAEFEAEAERVLEGVRSAFSAAASDAGTTSKPAATHAEVMRVAREAQEQRERAEEAEQQLESYGELPLDIALARVEVGRARAEVEELERVLDLRVSILAARGLAPRDGGTADPFAVVYMSPEDEVKPRTRNLTKTLVSPRTSITVRQPPPVAATLAALAAHGPLPSHPPPPPPKAHQLKLMQCVGLGAPEQITLQPPSPPGPRVQDPDASKHRPPLKALPPAPGVSATASSTGDEGSAKASEADSVTSVESGSLSEPPEEEPVNPRAVSALAKAACLPVPGGGGGSGTLPPLPPLPASSPQMASSCPKSPLLIGSPLSPVSSQDGSSGVSSVCNSCCSSGHMGSLLTKSAASLPPFMAAQKQGIDHTRRLSCGDTLINVNLHGSVTPSLERAGSPTPMLSHVRKMPSMNRFPLPRRNSHQPNRKVEKKQPGYGVADCVLVVGNGNLAVEYEEQVNAQGGTVVHPFELSYTASLHNAVPYLGTEDIPPTIWNFCFPCGLQITADEPGQPSIHTFVLTGMDGARNYVTCLSFQDKMDPAQLQDLLNRYAQLSHTEAAVPQTAWVSKAVCVMSSRPFFSFFHKLLADFYHVVIESQEDSINLEQMTSFITRTVPMPVPGAESLDVQLAGFTLPRLWLPPENHMAALDVPLHPLFYSIGINNLVSLFYAAVTEHKILFISSDIMQLATACEALVSLLYPFNWTNVYVPFLPVTLLDFLYSPMPFIMGIPKMYVPRINPMPEDVILVDLDESKVVFPLPLSPYAGHEGDVLFADLRHILSPEAIPMSSLDYEPWQVRSPVHPAVFNWLARAAFVKFWASLLRDYRDHIMYVRVFPKPIAIFDKKRFAQHHAEAAKAFLEQLMDSQMFGFFLQSMSRPVQNAFDEMVALRCWECTVESLSELLRQPHDLVMLLPATVVAPSLITFLPKKGAPLRMEEGLVEAVPVARPQSRPDPVVYKASVPISVGAGGVQAVEGLAAACECDDLFARVVKALLAGDDVDLPSVSAVIENLRTEQNRLRFVSILTSNTTRTKGVCELSTKSFGTLSDIMKEAITQAFAHKEKDFESTRLLLDLLDVYYHVVEGVEYFILTRLRSLDAWQNHAFWENSFFVKASDATRARYKNPLQQHVEEYNAMTPEQRTEVTHAEQECIFTLLSDFGFKMANLAVSPVTTRRFISKMTSAAGLDEERTKLLQQLIKNMSRIELTEEKQSEQAIESEDHQSKLQFSSDHANYVPIGMASTGDQEQQQPEWVNNLNKLLSVNTKPWLDGVRRNVESLFAGSPSPVSPGAGTQATFSYRGHYISRLLEGHAQPVLCLAQAAGVLCSGSADATIGLWDQRGVRLTALAGHEGWVNCLAVDAESSRLVSGSYDHTVKLWDLAKMAKIRTFRGHRSSISALHVCARGVLSASYDCTLGLWDPRTAKCVQRYEGHSAAVTCMAVDAATELVATGSRDATIRLWDLRAGKVAGVLPGHSDWIRCLRFIPRVLHCTILTSGGYDGQVRVWDATPHSGACLKSLEGHEGPVNDLVWDGRYLCSAGTDSTVKLWDLLNMQSAGELEGHGDEVIVLARVMDNKFIASAGYDSTIQIWDTQAYAKGRPACRQSLSGHTNRVTALCALTPSMIASAGWDSTVRLWEFAQDFR
eukprot:m51a1_g679 hypothetical protein (1778) ;mRNA; r:300530-307798